MRRAGLLIFLVALPGCVKPPPAREVTGMPPAPEAFGAGETATDATSPVAPRWWEDFRAPGLTAVVDEALAENHDLRASAARVERSLAEARIAGADLEPEVEAGLAASRRRQNFIGFPLPGGGVLSTTSTNLGVSLNVSWEADLWGRLRAGARAALAEAQAAEADHQAAHLSLAGQTVKAWLAAAALSQQLELAERTVESWRGSYEQLRGRYEHGVRPALDVRLARSNLASAEAVVAARRRQLDGAVRQLEILLGRYPSRSWPAPAELPEPPAAIPGGLPADLVARRPDLVAAERHLAAADQRLLAARRNLYPRFSLTASGGTVSDELGDLVDGDFRVWSLASNLLQPIFQGGRLRAGVDRAEAGATEAVESFTAGVLRAYGEVETSLAADADLAREEELLAESAHQAQAARELAEDRYASGLEDYVTVLEAQRREFGAESAHLVARRTRLENRVDLYLALGGGFERPGGGAAGASPRTATAGATERTEP